MVSNISKVSDGLSAFKSKTGNAIKKLCSRPSQDVTSTSSATPSSSRVNKDINKEIKKEKKLKKYDYLVIGIQNSGKSTLAAKIAASDDLPIFNSSSSSSSSSSSNNCIRRTSSFVSEKKKCCLYEVDESLLWNVSYSTCGEDHVNEKLKEIKEESEPEESEESEETEDLDDYAKDCHENKGRRKVSKTFIEILDETSTGIIFCADVSSFESIQKSLALLKLVTEEVFMNKPIIVYLTKEQQLQQTLQTSSFKDHFPDFQGQNNCEDVLSYLTSKKFVSQSGLTLTFLKDCKDERQFLLVSSDEIFTRSLISSLA